MTDQGFQHGARHRSSKLGKLLRLRRAIRNWPRALLDHIHLTKADYVCHLRNGATFEVRGGTDDRHVIFELFVERIYPVQVDPGDVVVDIGAQIGCFAVWAARQGARVFAFEPFPPNFAALQRNTARNYLQDVKIFKSAVAGTREAKKLFLPDDKTHSGRYSIYADRGTEAVNVDCITLDDLFSANTLEHVDLLKIDCQGAEYEILYQASPQTIAKVSTIVVECEEFVDGSNRSVEEMATYLKKMGFEISMRENLIYASKPPIL